MRNSAALLFLSLSTVGQCQMAGLATGVREFGNTLDRVGFWKGQQQKQNPLQPTGFPGLPPRDGSLPPGLPGQDEDRQLRILSAPKTRYESKKFFAEGGVRVQYRGYDIFCDALEADTETEVFVGSGNVKLIGADSVISGGQIRVDFKQKSFEAKESAAELRPSLLQKRVLDDVYTTGATIYGTERRIFCEHGSFTTCSKEHPHYEFEADNVDLRPGKRIILKDVRFRLFDKTILALPYLSVPLEERRDRYLPEVGQSRDEGYYAKFKFGIPLHKDNLLDTNLDYFTKLGVGLGAGYVYDNLGSSGLMKVYGLLGPLKTFTINQQHSGSFLGGTLSTSGNLQKATYFNAPENRTWDFRAGWTLPTRGGSTRLGFAQNRNESSGFRYGFESISFGDSRQWNSRWRSDVDLSLQETKSEFTNGGTQREQLDVRVRSQYDLKRAMAELEYLRSIPVGDTASFFPASDRTPVLKLSSDSRRLFGSREFFLPFNAETSVGEYFDPSSKTRVSRGLFDLSANKADSGQSRLGGSFNGRFRQSVYSDDTAQYMLSMNSGVQYRFGQNRSLNLNYSYLRPYGYSPLQQDRTGQTNYLTADVRISPIRNFTVAAQTGYDFLLEREEEVAWQSVGVRAEWKPKDWFVMRGLSTYDPVRHLWSNSRLDFTWKAGDTLIAAGARYDGSRHTWGNVNLYIDGLKAGRFKASALLAYNGFLKEFETRQVSLTYDMHCVEAILEVLDSPVGFRPGTTFGFYLRLKALPFETPFGRNRRGAPIGIGTGRDGF